MKDGLVRRAIKRVARVRYRIDLWVTRRARRAVIGPSPYRLAGACEGCGLCCESPQVPAPAPFFRLRSLRWLFLTWHGLINGFELLGEDHREGVFTFRCTHFDAETRRCDSYDSRPGLCRDYPRNLLDGPRPDLFESCGYRALADNGEGLKRALEAEGLSEEEIAALSKRLYFDV